MKKLDYEDIGILITREIKSMLLDGNISFEDRGKILFSIITGESLENPMMKAFADSLRAGYELTNNKRKAEIAARRERQKTYLSKRKSTVDECASTDISVDTSTVDERSSTEIDAHLRVSPIYNKTKQNKTSQYIPLNPPEGDGRCPPELTIEDIFPGAHAIDPVEELANRIEATEAFGHMRVKRRKLLRALNVVLQKNTGAEIIDGIDRWTRAWAEDGWQFCPGSISDWISDGKFLQQPREKKSGGENYDDVGVKEIV